MHAWASAYTLIADCIACSPGQGHDTCRESPLMWPGVHIGLGWEMTHHHVFTKWQLCCLLDMQP